jgi:hypothetical protein
MPPTRQQRLEHFKGDIYGRVEGRLGDRMWQIIDLLGAIFDSTACTATLPNSGRTTAILIFTEHAAK